MERGDYWNALLRGWWLIVVFGLVGLAAGLVSPRQPVQTNFVSTSSVGSPPTGSDSSGLDSPDQIIYYGGTDAVLAAASKASGLNWPTYIVRDALTLIGPPAADGSTGLTSGQAGVIDVQIGAPTAADSLALNSAFDQALGDQLNAVAKSSLAGAVTGTEQKLASIEDEIVSNSYPPGVTTGALQIQETALENYLATLVVASPSTGYSVLHTPVLQEVNKVTSGAILNSRALRAAVGLLLGLVLGALLALAVWLLDRRLKTAKRAQHAFGYPVVAEIPADTSDSTEPYRMLWLSVFREPLPLPPSDEQQWLYEGEDPVLENGAGNRSSQMAPQ
jgi:hypothetical protein